MKESYCIIKYSDQPFKNNYNYKIEKKYYRESNYKANFDPFILF